MGGVWVEALPYVAILTQTIFDFLFNIHTFFPLTFMATVVYRDSWQPSVHVGEKYKWTAVASKIEGSGNPQPKVSWNGGRTMVEAGDLQH